MRDVVIVGAGIVGLATALRLLEKRPGLKVTVLEKEEGPAKHQTGNNSGVIHAGVYYKPGSLKARNCIEGYSRLVQFCEKEEIKYELCGKIIVATREEELPGLEELYKRARQNGLNRVVKIDGPKIKEFEPHTSGIKALHVPYTGIVDYAEVAERYAQIIKGRFGAEIFYEQEVVDVVKGTGRVEVISKGVNVQARLLINTAGLFSDRVALMTEDNLDVRIIPFRGEYVELKADKIHLVNNLIYPVPNPEFPFLGVHFTRMINGGIEAGPNAVWAFKQEGYHKTSFNKKDFLRSMNWPGFRKVMKQYWKTGAGEYWRSFNKLALTKALNRLVPEISHRDLLPGGAGVRAQACDRSGRLIDDFLIKENEWAINVLNAPSPAATASLAIGDSISELAMKRF